MGREIKFRGKRVDNGEWVYGYGVVVGEHYGRIHDEEREASIFVEYDKVSRLNFQLVDVSPETVGQYTGLKDKNGRAIYEGDIVKYEEEDGKIEYHSEEAMFVVAFDTWLTDFDHINGRDLEVIGNIYENRELEV